MNIQTKRKQSKLILYQQLETISQDVNNTGSEALPVSVCNCFLYFTCKENIL